MNIRMLKSKKIGSSSQGDVSDYNALLNRPQINGVTLTGNKTSADLALANASDVEDLVGNKAWKIGRGLSGGRSCKFTFDGQSGGLLALAGASNALKGLYIVYATSTGGVSFSPISAVTSSSVTITASGTELTVNNGTSGALLVYYIGFTSRYPTVETL